MSIAADNFGHKHSQGGNWGNSLLKVGNWGRIASPRIQNCAKFLNCTPNPAGELTAALHASEVPPIQIPNVMLLS